MVGRTGCTPLFWSTSFFFYIPFWLILTLHLFTRQDPIRMSVPSAASPYFLLVVLTESTLFRRLLSLIWLGHLWVHLMQWWRIYLKPPPLRIPTWVPFYPPLLPGAFWGPPSTWRRSPLWRLGMQTWDAEDRVILGCAPRLFSLSLFVLGKFPPWHGPWTLVERGPCHKFSGPTIAPQNSPIRLLGRIGGFWWHQTSVNTCQSLSPIGSWDFSSARDTFLELLKGETCPY